MDTLGNPVVVTLNEPGIPTNIVAVGTLVICGPSLTFRMRDCWAGSPVSVDVSVTVYWPPVPAAGVPLIAAGFPEVKLSPVGSALPNAIVPVLAETENDPECPAVNVAVFGLVNTGLFKTVSG